MRKYIGYPELIGNYDRNLGGVWATLLQQVAPPPPPPPPIAVAPPTTYVAPPPAPLPVAPLTPPPVIQVPISPPSNGFMPDFSVPDLPGIGPPDDMSPIGIPGWNEFDDPFGDPFFDPQLIGPRGGPPKAMPGATAGDIDAQQIDPETGQPIEAIAFPIGVPGAKQPLTQKQKQNLGVAAAVALFLLFGG